MKRKYAGFTFIEVMAAVVMTSIIFGGVILTQVYQAEHLRKLEFSKDVLDINEALITYFFFDGEA